MSLVGPDILGPVGLLVVKSTGRVTYLAVLYWSSAEPLAYVVGLKQGHPG